MCPSRALDSLLIEPHSKFRLYWDGVSCVLIAFIALALPYRSAFAVDWSLLWTLIDFFIDVFFIVDIFINLRTMYHGLDGQLVMNTRLIFLRCTRTHAPLHVPSRTAGAALSSPFGRAARSEKAACFPPPHRDLPRRPGVCLGTRGRGWRSTWWPRYPSTGSATA
jgi:hypothetical protein